MTEEAFLREYLVEWRPDETMERLAQEYHERCGRFDLAVCSGRGPDGTALPASPREQAIISTHARRVFDELATMCDRNDLRDAIRRCDQMNDK